MIREGKITLPFGEGRTLSSGKVTFPSGLEESEGKGRLHEMGESSRGMKDRVLSSIEINQYDQRQDGENAQGLIGK